MEADHTLGRSKSGYAALLGGPLCLGASLFIGHLQVEAKNGFGSGDLPALAFWTVPLAIAVMFLFPFLIKLNGHGTVPERILGAMFLGALCGFANTILVGFMLGPFAGLFSFSVLLCWIIGGMVGASFAQAVLIVEKFT